VGARVGGARCARGPVGWGDGRLEREWDGRMGDRRGSGMGALGFGDYLYAGLPVAKSAPNPYTTTGQERLAQGAPSTAPGTAADSPGRPLSQAGCKI
jgi:hypothetical protein